MNSKIWISTRRRTEYICIFTRIINFLLRDFLMCSKENIKSNRPLIQSVLATQAEGIRWFLTYDGEVLAILPQIIFRHRNPINKDFTRNRIVKPLNQSHSSRLATSGGTNQRNILSWFNIQIQPSQYIDIRSSSAKSRGKYRVGYAKYTLLNSMWPL